MSYATDRADQLYRQVSRQTNFAYDPMRACKARDIAVTSVYMPHGMFGQSIISNRCASIFINQGIASDAFRRYVLSHELGHCIMHRGESTPFMRETMNGGFIPTIEREANEFAFRYLFKQLDDDDLYRMSLSDITEYFGVPEEYQRFIIL